MITIRVVAWPERAYLSAHAAKATPGKSPSESDGELVAASTNTYRPCCEHPIPAHQARAITLATTTAPSHDNPRDGVARTFPPHRTCSQSDSR